MYFRQLASKFNFLHYVNHVNYANFVDNLKMILYKSHFGKFFLSNIKFLHSLHFVKNVKYEVNNVNNKNIH